MPNRLTPLFKFNEEQIAALRQIAPEAFRDGVLDFGALCEALGDVLPEEDDAEAGEHYGLQWAGKRQAKRAASLSPSSTLVPVPGDGVNEETTKNIYIEGDNLEALKVIQKSYAGQVKMIYIDPPYNTGNDFVYKDDFSESVESYEARAGMVDEQGKRLTTNKRADGRFHANWLSMMYPRLRIARNLLRDDGVIFISIDDNEVHNLRHLCDEVFGAENFVGCIIWQTATDNNPTQIATQHEYVVCYVKAMDAQGKWLIPSAKAEAINKKYLELKNLYGADYKSIQKDLGKWIAENEKSLEGAGHYRYVDEIGVYYPGNSSNTKPGGYMFDIIHPKTKKVCKKPDYGYRWPAKTFWEADSRGDVEWGVDETTIPKLKKRINTVTEMLKSYYYEDNRIWTKNLNAMFGGRVFENPKSVNLIMHFLRFISPSLSAPSISSPSPCLRSPVPPCETPPEKPPENSHTETQRDRGHRDDIILDFFSGSATTAHAVMQLNAEDGGNRQFIMVQLPEICDAKSEAAKAGYKNICEIGKERIRRAGKQIAKGDTGFRVYRLAPSNFRKWRNYEGTDTAELEKLFAEDPLVPGWTPESLLTEIMLQEGFPLDSRIEKLKGFTENAVQKVSSDSCEHSLLVCLDKTLSDKTTAALVEAMDAARRPGERGAEGRDINVNDIFICLDSALSDKAKAQIDDKGIIKTV
jgi:adenine-specific DNA-methyltransferase